MSFESKMSKTMKFAPPGAAREFLSATVMSFCMNNLGVEVAVVKPLLETKLGFKNVDSNHLFLTVLFIHLCFFFGPFYNRKSHGALHNPAVYFLFFLIGDLKFGECLNGAFAAVGGTVLGTWLYKETISLFPLPGFSGITPAVAAGGAMYGTVSEATVAFVNFAFAGVSGSLVGNSLKPYAGAFFYVITIVLEKCKYSCGFMNPAVVFASHAVGGDLRTKQAATHILIYSAGAVLGAAAAAGLKWMADGFGKGGGKKNNTGAQSNSSGAAKKSTGGKKTGSGTKKATSARTRSSARVKTKKA